MADKKLTVQQLYDIARKQELDEYYEAVKLLAKVTDKWEESKEEDLYAIPRIAACPKHAESTMDFDVVGIDKDGYLTLDDGYALWDPEAPHVVEYGHLQYVTSFIYSLIEEYKNNG